MRRRRVLGWRERGKEAPLCGAQNHGRIFLSLSFLLPHPVDSRQLVKQSVSRFGCSLDGAEPERMAMPLLRWLRSSVAVSMMFLLLLHHSISILEQWGGGRRAASGRRFYAGLRAMAVSLGKAPPHVAASCAVTAVRPEVGVSPSHGPAYRFADINAISRMDGNPPPITPLPSYVRPHSRKSLSLPLILWPLRSFFAQIFQGY